MQSRTQSLIESLLNILSGAIISVIAGQIIFPLYGLAVTIGQNVQITLIFTAISIARSYAWRRGFNWWNHVRKPRACAGRLLHYSDYVECRDCGQAWDYGDEPATHSVRA